MEFFEVEGMTVLHWRRRAAARSEDEAVEGVRERIAACLGNAASPVTFTSVEHRMVQCEPSDPGEHR